MEKDISNSLFRLLGTAERLDLSEDLKEKVKSHVLIRLGRSTTSRPEAIELKIRALVQSQAIWIDIEPNIRKWIKTKKEASVVTRAIEMAVLYGASDSIMEFLEVGKLYGSQVIEGLHKKVRLNLVARYFRSEVGKMYANLLFSAKNETWLSGLERLLVFLHLVSDKPSALVYLKSFEREILDASEKYTNVTGVTLGSVLITCARLSIDLNAKGDAIFFLKSVKPSDSSFSDALKLLKGMEVDERTLLESQWARSILENIDWKSRLFTLEQYLEMCRKKDAKSQELIPVLNLLLLKNELIIGERLEVISAFATLCMKFFDLVDIIPNIESTFRANTLEFHIPSLDGAIWHPVLRPEFIHCSEQRWRAVALVHRYVSGGARYEDNLTTAFEIFQKHESKQATFYTDWTSLLSEARSAVKKSLTIPAAEKEIMEIQLGVADLPDKIRMKQVEDYLDRISYKDYRVLCKLLKIADALSPMHLNLSIVCKLGESNWYRNSDLSKVWSISTERGLTDLSWRVASVAKFRGCLSSHILSNWNISGENRSHYGFPKIQKKQVDCCFYDMTSDERRMCQSLLNLDGRLRDLLPEIDLSLTEFRWKPESSRDKRVTENLIATGWFGTAKKRYTSMQSIEAGPMSPYFVEAMPVNSWADTMGWISELTAVSYISGKKEKILKISETANSTLQPRSESGNDSFGAKWIKSLTPQQKMSWHEFIQCLRKMNSVQIDRVLSIFIIRLSTIFYANHLLALQSLSLMGAKIELIRSLENWILSEGLSDLRAEIQVDSKIKVPDFVAHAPLISYPV